MPLLLYLILAIELKDIKSLKQESLKCNLLIKNLVKEGVYQKRAFVVEMCLLKV